MTASRPAARACDESPPPELLEAVAQFNRGEYFEQHETFEALWRAETRPIRALYQGLLQIGVAFHQVRRRNYHGAVVMLARGAAHLEPFAPRCLGVDVAQVLADAADARRAIEALGAARLDAFDWTLAPRIRLL